jgi:hypothetical protein
LAGQFLVDFAYLEAGTHHDRRLALRQGAVPVHDHLTMGVSRPAVYRVLEDGNGEALSK